MHVRTKLHILASNINPKTNERGDTHKQIKDMLGAASYIADSDVLDLLKRQDAARSIRTVIEAGIARLPHSPMVVEFELMPEYHEFVLLKEGDEGTILANYAMLENNTHVGFTCEYEVVCTMHTDGGKPAFTLEMPANALKAEVVGTGIGIALGVSLLMLNTRGIEKQVIECVALNKQREKKGKASIPTHTVVHIGTIYRRDGSAIDRPKGGWHMPMHLRSGYTRRQHYGIGREQEKLVYIPPCIVNFKPDEEVPLPKKSVRV